MSSYDEITDPIYQKMVAAWEGDPETWGRINRGLRDAMVDYANRRCAYYRNVIPGSGTFWDIPVLTKGLVREHLDDLLAEDVPESRRVAKETAGSTGEPLRFFRDSAQGPMEYLSARRFLKRLHGLEDEVAIVWISVFPPHALPDDPEPGRRRFRSRRPDGRFRLLPCSTHGLDRERFTKETAAWARAAPYALYGYASTLAWMADEIASGGVPLPARPDTVITTGDTLTHEMQDRIGEAFGAPIHSWYGSHELNGYLAGTLPGDDRYAFNPLLGHVEILRDDGTPAAPGELGRLVVTDLNNHVMPMLRYDTGDLAIESERRWRGGWRLADAIVGRSSEILRLPDDRILTHMLVGQALFRLRDFHPHIRFYQCAQTAPDELMLRVVWRHPPSEDLRRDVGEALRAVAGPRTKVTVTDVERLDVLRSGKTWVLRREF